MIKNRPIVKDSFKQYLESVCFEENPTVLDDDMSDFFDDWLSHLDVEEVIEYGNEFGLELLNLLDEANNKENEPETD